MIKFSCSPRSFFLQAKSKKCYDAYMLIFIGVFFSLCFANFGLWAMPQQVILIRHAEKPTTGDTLSPRGFQRADALVRYFSQSNPPFPLKQPIAIYAQRSSDGHHSTRPVQTAAPLANSWQVPLYTFFSDKNYADMIDEIDETYNSGLVLICWSHDTLPAIAKKFGVPKPPEWPGSNYDWVWVINFGPKRDISFQMFNQTPL
jgi:hypothetical protein